MYIIIIVYIIITVIGCAFGGIVRHILTNFVNRLIGEQFPWGTLVVNSVGSFLLGLILGIDLSSVDKPMSSFIGLGFCGGLTTFSTFSIETFRLVSKKAWYKASSNMLLSVLVCFFCVLVGHILGELATK